MVIALLVREGQTAQSPWKRTLPFNPKRKREEEEEEEKRSSPFWQLTATKQ